MRPPSKLASLLAGAIAAAVVAPAPAQAAVGYDRCPYYKSCYFSQSSGQGTMYQAPGPGWQEIPFDVKSVYNRGGGNVTLYHWDYSSAGYTFYVNQKGSCSSPWGITVAYIQ